MRKPAEERRIISPLKYFLMQCNMEALVIYLHDTKASWGITRPHTMNDRKQSQAYRARIHIQGRFEHKASGDTAKAALCNALASFLTYENEDYHTLVVNANEESTVRHEGRTKNGSRPPPTPMPSDGS